MPQADVNPQKIPVLFVENLKNDIEYYIDLSVAASTKQTYSAGEKRFIAFVKLYRPHEGKHLLPASEETLVQFLAYLAKTIKHTSIKNYLAAVRHFPIQNGFPLDCQKMSRLQLVLRGIKRSQGDEKRVRLPITIHHLKLFHMMLAIPSNNTF
ncbi:Retrovirus-related Pol poly from transposon 412 [Paramuricea clavata]|uniref:Retrovirus-related Pol poly from transposon 412 n=1 Tax=Paramuricea clavata TaxID=317549 RepID=A0A6S7FGG7_PARCT|nr:Retrovirus-related Pol poly from transposon 412 [Paramuricea clavata]